jgi:hypothetical protein
MTSFLDPNISKDNIRLIQLDIEQQKTNQMKSIKNVNFSWEKRVPIPFLNSSFPYIFQVSGVVADRRMVAYNKSTQFKH